MTSKVKMPEPVAVVVNDYAIFWAGSGPIDPLCKRTGTKVGSQLITTEQAETYAKAVRDEAVKRARPTYYGDGYQAGWNSALERAMKVIESANKNFIMTADNAGAARAAITRCGDAIRALKEQS